MSTLTPRLQKDWTVSANIRLTPYVSLVATMGWFMYENKTKLLAAGGWTLKWSCDGVTGPTSAGDTTDRITSAASFSVRATTAPVAQSWFIVQATNGCQLLFTYMGATDDVAYIAYSQGGLFTLNGTNSNRQPTATDQANLTAPGMSLINSTTSGDRVMSIWVAANSWGNALFRGGTLQQYIGLETFDSAVTPTLQATPMLVHRILSNTLVNTASNKLITFQNEHPADGTGWGGVFTFHNYAGVYKYTRGMAYAIGYQTAAFGYSVNANTNPWATSTSTPRLQNNAAIGLIPLILNGISSGQSFAFNDIDNYGFMGVAIDWWWGMNHNTLLNDVFGGYEPTDLPNAAVRSNWLIAFGPGCIRPWRNASGSGMETA